MNVCNEISSRCWEADFWCGCGTQPGSPKMSKMLYLTVDLDFDPENEVKVQKSQNFDWPYLRSLLS